MFNNEEAIYNWLKNKKNSRTLEAGDIKPQQRITGSSLLKSIHVKFWIAIRKTALINISYRPSPYVIYGFRFLQPHRRQVWAFGSDPELPAPFACRGNGYLQISPIFQIIAFLWYALTRYWATFTSEFCYTRISPLHYQQLASEFPLSSLQHPCCRFHGFF